MKILNKLRDRLLTQKPNKIEWGVVIITYFLIFGTMYYQDNYEIFYDHFYKWEMLFAGESVDFLGATTLPYGVIHQWFCELWVLPVNLFHHWFGLDYMGPIAILWYKLCIPLCFSLCIREMNKIAYTFGMDDEQIKWAQILFMTTILVVLPVFHIAQTDAAYLWLVLLGFHALIKGNTKKFLFWFAIAISFKMIALFIFIPLVLLTEKRIFKIFYNLILGCMIIPIQQIWYKIVEHINMFVVSMNKNVEIIPETNNAGTDLSAVVQIVEENTGGVENFYARMASNVLCFQFPAVRRDYTASLLIFLFATFCIWCYIQNIKDERDGQQKCVYTVVVALIIFFLTASPYPYWIIILYPFLFLLAYMRQGNLRVNLLLVQAFTLSIFLVYVMTYYWVYGGAQTFELLFLGRYGLIPTGHEFMGAPNIAGYLKKLYVDAYLPVVIGICLACGLGIIVVNSSKVERIESLTKEYTVKLQHGMVIFNLFVLLGWYVINVILIGKY